METAILSMLCGFTLLFVVMPLFFHFMCLALLLARSAAKLF